MNHATMQELIEGLTEMAGFLKRLNHFWFSELKTCIAKADELASHADSVDYESLLDEIEYMLHGKNQLGDLFVSSPVKREEYRKLLHCLREKFKKVKITVS